MSEVVAKILVPSASHIGSRVLGRVRAHTALIMEMWRGGASQSGIALTIGANHSRYIKIILTENGVTDEEMVTRAHKLSKAANRGAGTNPLAGKRKSSQWRPKAEWPDGAVFEDVSVELLLGRDWGGRGRLINTAMRLGE